MSDFLTIRQLVQRSKNSGIPVSEAALRCWIKTGDIRVTYSGNRAYIYWPNFIDFVKRGTATTITVQEPAPGQIRRVDQ